MSNKAKISPKEERKLHTKSQNTCPICGIDLVDPSNPNAPCIGENAHIYGENPGSARYDPSIDKNFVNSEQNLIFVCCNCHTKIDNEIEQYTPERLFELKRSHEIKSLHVDNNVTDFLSNINKENIMADIRCLRNIKKDNYLLIALNNEDFISPFNSSIIDQLSSYVLSIENCDFNCDEVSYLANTSLCDIRTLLNLINEYTRPITGEKAIMKRIGKYGDIENENFDEVKEKMFQARKKAYYSVEQLFLQEEKLKEQLSN